MVGHWKYLTEGVFPCEVANHVDGDDSLNRDSSGFSTLYDKFYPIPYFIITYFCTR